MRFRYSIAGACLTLFLLGCCSLAAAWITPVWKDNEKAYALENEVLPVGAELQPEAYGAYNRRWHTEIDALRTERYPLYDLGTGLIALSACVAFMIRALPLKTRADFAALSTPASPITLLLIAAIAWSGFWLSEIVAVVSAVHRFEVPPWADTLAIPFFAFYGAFAVGALPFLVIVWLAGVWGSDLPSSMWLWKKHRPWASWITSVLASIPLAPFLLMLAVAVEQGPFLDVPVAFLLIYLSLALRAAALSRFR